MNTLKQKNLESLIFKTIDKEIEGTDIYNHNGSMWVIFTDDKKWVVEYTKDQTLWYNYSLFNSIMTLFGMNNNETAEYVKTWFENKFLFKPKVEEINHVDVMKFFNNKMDDTIQNGVKHIKKSNSPKAFSIDNTIQNGVKNSQSFDGESLKLVENTIQNGVKNTQWGYLRDPWVIENIVQKGVKTAKGFDMDDEEVVESRTVEDTIQNGVKDTLWSIWEDLVHVGNTIQNGVKNSEGVDFNEDFDDVIKNGVKS